jgi:hypothetical protein
MVTGTLWPAIINCRARGGFAGSVHGSRNCMTPSYPEPEPSGGRIICSMRVPSGRTVTAIALACLACALASRGATASSDSPGNPNFASDIAPILLSRCAFCHRPGQAAPFSLLSYADAQMKSKEIAAATTARRMPPWLATQGPGFPTLQDDPRLTDRQVTMIARWVAKGMPAGNLRRLPALPSFPMSWPLGTPDVIAGLPRRIPMPADEPGTTVNVVVPLGFPADLWIGALDYEAGDNRVVRHARFFIAPPDLAVGDADVLPGVGGLLGNSSLENYSDQLFKAARSLTELGGWVPGMARRVLPDNLAIRARARSNLVVQLHVEPQTADVAEEGRVAIYFAKPLARRAVKPVEVPPASGIAAGLSIPAGEPRYVLKDSFVLPVDVEAVGARAHAHRLARDMTMTAALAGGKTQGLLRIAEWNVDWPDTYYFTTPIRLPRGTAINVEIGYDNSTDNSRNLFTPPRRIGWGRITSGEMGSMTLLIASTSDDDARAIDDAAAAHLRQQLVRKITMKN